MNKYPRKQHDQPAKPSLPEQSGNILRIGNKANTRDIYEDGKRLLKWIPSEEDMKIASFAGWSKLPHGLDENGLGFIEIPEGTRSASSVLSGVEAWSGEKAAILDSIANYQRAVFSTLGLADVGVALDSVAVTRDHQVFHAPPHTLTDDREVIGVWVDNFLEDLNRVLKTEPIRSELVRDYSRKLEGDI